MSTVTKVTSAEREQWSSQFGFLMAAIGSAIGLGNIWRFPGVAYENGGGAFIIPYLFALLFAGCTILLLDYAVGHRFRGSPPLAFRRISSRAEMLGWWQVLICFVILVYYAVIIGWSISYAGFSFTKAWGDDPTAFFVGDFLQLTEDVSVSTSFVPWVAIPLVAVWLLTVIVLALGVHRGIERSAKIFIPILVIMFVILVARALTLPGAADGLDAFFTPNWAALLNGEVWLQAFAQIFYSLSVAFGIMLTYSSYLPRKANLSHTGLIAAFANSAFELLAGIGVFATLGFMAYQQNTTVDQLEGLKGVTLSFMTFPQIISQMPGGSVFGFLFFASLAVAGFTSLISLVQVVSSAIQDKFGLSTRFAAILVGILSGIISLGFFGTRSCLNVLDVVDNYINAVGVVSSALIMCVLLAVGVPLLPLLRQHINSMSTIKIGPWWDLLVGFVAPSVLAGMLLTGVISLVTKGYGDYPAWFIGLFGWGALVLALVLAFILTIAPWSTKIDSYEPVPLPENPRVSRYAATLGFDIERIESAAGDANSVQSQSDTDSKESE